MNTAKKNGIKYKPGMTFGNWKLIKRLGRGGNGEVWQCEGAGGQLAAVKLLQKLKPIPYQRFLDETETVSRNSDVPGIMPIIDKHLPDQLGLEQPFYVMPLSEPSETVLKGKELLEKINAVIEIATVVSKLHQREIYHRDIKPANILFLDGVYYLADFGLVSFPDKKDISQKNEEIGPKWTMAPEMRRNSSTADRAPADVYSLAKTLWIYLTGNEKGFDGQYSVDSIIHLKKFYPSHYTTPIDNILMRSTDNDPLKRPDIDDFISGLLKWKELEENFHEQNLEQWFEVQTKLFPTSIPSRVIWEDIDDILKILKVVCSYDNLNHTFFPGGGGLDMEDACRSLEDGCIELYFGTTYIVKPKRLIFESFGYHHDWNYFMLENYDLEKTDVYEEDDPSGIMRNTEDLIEIYPMNYKRYDYNYMDDDEYYSGYRPKPKMRYISRSLGGNFVLFCKRSSYNLNGSTYDGRHNKVSVEEFRNYIQRNVNANKKKHEEMSFIESIVDRSLVNKNRRLASGTSLRSSNIEDDDEDYRD